MVSSRKYRPATFDTVVGQSHVTNTLKNAVRSGHLAQAFLFCGPRGVGKTTCARILAKTINCLNLSAETEPCNACASCEAFNHSASFNIYELDAASNNSVDDIRALVEQVRYAPQGAKYKVYIIDEVHMLSAAAFNAFLKTLEEPPPYAIFILATTERHKILPTILSRCQIYNFNRIRLDDSVGQLKKICDLEGITYENEALYVISQRADGALRDALTILDQLVNYAGNHLTYQAAIENLNVLDAAYYFNTMDAVYAEDAGAALVLLEEIISHGFDGHLFLTGLAEHCRNLLVARDARVLTLLEIPQEQIQKMLEQSNRFSHDFLLNTLHVLSSADQQYKNARNHRLVLELALIRLANLPALLRTAQLWADEKKKPSLEGILIKNSPAIPTSSEPQRHAVAAQPVSAINIWETTPRAAQSAPVITTVETLNAAIPEQVPEQKPMGEEGFRNAFTAYLKEKRNYSLATMFDKFELLFDQASQTITVKVPSTTMQNMVNDERTPFIRLFNFHFQTEARLAFELDIQPTNTETSFFTSKAKFEKMLEENPVLREMAQVWGISID